jgi:PAS domain S-box-containing protein
MPKPRSRREVERIAEGGVRTAERGDAATKADSDRALQLRRGYVEYRASFRAPVLGASYEPTLTALLDLVVPKFCDWCVIDVADEDGISRRFAVRGRGDEIDDAALAARVPMLAVLVERVLRGGSSESWPGGGAEAPWCAVVGLRVKDRPFATVSFVLSEDSPGFRELDLAVAEEVAWGVGSLIERIVLHQDAREALRGTQRLASRLHQLIAASITVAGLRSEPDVLANLANSARRVFDADVAVLSLETGPSSPLVGVALKDQRPVCLAPEDVLDLDVPAVRRAVTAPWVEGEWLVAPVLERRDRARGVLALRRASFSYAAEDREVLALLAQMASSALAATELSRGIEQSETRLRTLVDTAPAGIVEVDLEGRARWWNRAASKIFAWPLYNAASSAEPAFPASAEEDLDALWAEARRGEGPSVRDLVDVEIRGRRRDLTTSAALLALPDEPLSSVLMLVDDVTDHRELKAEVQHAQQMEVRGRVASSVAHDFNNLLTLISGYAEILTRELADDEHSLSMVKDIQSTASRASMLTAQLQSIGRTPSTEPAVLDPAAILQSNAEVFERILGAEIEPSWSLDHDAGNIRVDGGQFEQMMLNLAINARDAMPQGGELRVGVDGVVVDEARASELNVEAGEYVLITVADTGVGMDEETRRRCFDTFFTTKGPFKGTGLGLAAARRLVESSGGAITCRSQVGVGTTFEILFPVTREAVVEELSAPSTDRPRGSATVLVAEDDEGLRRLMTQVLARNGYHVVAAETGERALEAAHDLDGAIDLLVSDVVMPGLSGPEVAASLQSENPDLRVLLTSGTADASVLARLVPGTGGFLAKPFRPSGLIDAVHGLLSRR